MKSTKTQLKFFTLPDWEKEENYLSSMHKNGWMFTYVKFSIYHFEKCEPEDVVYQLDFNPEGSENKEEYVRMFSDCGWDYLQDFAGYSYFRKPRAEMNGDEKIFCDDESRLDMMKRVFRQRVIPLIILFLCTIIPNVSRHQIDPVIKYIDIALLVMYLAFFLYFAYRYLEYRNSISKK